jgi:hypothetical protein
MSPVASVHDEIILVGDEFLHLLEGGAHLSSTSNQSNKNLGISGIPLGIPNSQVIHKSHNILGLNSLNTSAGRTVIEW